MPIDYFCNNSLNKCETKPMFWSNSFILVYWKSQLSLQWSHDSTNDMNTPRVATLQFNIRHLLPNFIFVTGEAQVLPSIFRHPDCEVTAILGAFQSRVALPAELSDNQGTHDDVCVWEECQEGSGGQSHQHLWVAQTGIESEKPVNDKKKKSMKHNKFQTFCI